MDEQSLKRRLKQHSQLLKRSFEPLADRLAGFYARQWEQFQKNSSSLTEHDHHDDDHRHPIWPLWTAGPEQGRMDPRWNLRPRHIGHSVACVSSDSNISTQLLGQDPPLVLRRRIRCQLDPTQEECDEDQPFVFYCVPPVTGIGDEREVEKKEAMVERELQFGREFSLERKRMRRLEDFVDEAWKEQREDLV